MFHRRIRYTVFAAGVVAIGAPMASYVHAQTVKCFFKECIVYPDGARVCQVKEVPCPSET